MENIIEQLSSLDVIVGSPPFLLTVFMLSFVFKTCMLVGLVKQSSHSRFRPRLITLLSIVFFCSTLIDSAWILKIARSLWFPSLDYRLYLFWLRVSWGSYILTFQGLSLFIENLVTRDSKIRIHQKLLITISTILSLFFCLPCTFQFQLCSTYRQASNRIYYAQIRRHLLPIPSIVAEHFNHN